LAVIPSNILNFTENVDGVKIMAIDENITSQIPEVNETSLELYVTPKEAYAMWKADPEGIHILDVRTFEEYTFVGHLEMAKNIPFVFPKYDPKGPSLPGRPPGCYGELNPDFVERVIR
jgi:hypothetical protein